MLLIITAALISYLVGSIPTAYLFGRLLKGIDIRKYGSGNVGATNALRVLGKRIGIWVLLIDFFKGIIPVVFLGDFFLNRGVILSDESFRLILGLGSIIGHNWTIFLKFKGGKGVATSLGVLLGLGMRIPNTGKVFILVILVWLLVFIFSRIISLSSIIAAISFPPSVLFFSLPKSVFYFSLLTAFLIILRHRANIIRMTQGKEPQLNFFKSRNIKSN